MLGGISGAQDARGEQVSGMEQIEIMLDRPAIARYGISVADVNETIETALAGTEAPRGVEGQRHGRGQYPRPGSRRFRGGGPGKLAGLEFLLPPGYFLEYGGQFENQQRAMQRLAVVVPLALMHIFAPLYMALDSLRDSLLVICILPFALAGGVLAIVAIGIPLSVSAAVAFIVLLGIAVQNGVVLISFFRQLRAEGRSVDETIRTGCALRFRPLSMTALCSFI